MLIWLTTRNSEGEDRRLLVNPDQIQFAREINVRSANTVITFAGNKYSDGSRTGERVIFTIETLEEIYALITGIANSTKTKRVRNKKA